MNPANPAIRVERWPTEVPLLILVAVASLALWALLIFSVIGIIYAVMLAIFFFFGHIGFIAYVRGSAVKLGPDQFPELHARVRELSDRVGLRRVPDAYIMQAGGALNALATKFLRSNLIILFSDLLEACGDNTQARDMIVAHELGHHKAGHLRGMWLLLPGYFVPFLGTAWSRAREYTADRYGIAACEDRRSAIRGMSILAAGGRHGPQVNLHALVAQTGDLDSGLMTLGRWLSTHPPLSDRIAQIHPETAPALIRGHRGMARAVAGMLAALFLCVVAGGLFMRSLLPRFRQVMAEAEAAAANTSRPLTDAEAQVADVQAHIDITRIAALLDEHGRSQPLPGGIEDLKALWDQREPEENFPADPFDGHWYGYQIGGQGYVLWSTGRSVTDDADDIVYDSSLSGFR